MLEPIIHVVEMALGTALLYLSVVLWVSYRRFSSGALAVSGLLIYSSVILKLLENYSIISLRTFFIVNEIPLVPHLLTILTLISFIITVVLFIQEERAFKK